MDFWLYISFSLHSLLLFTAMGYIRGHSESVREIHYFKGFFFFFALAWIVQAISIHFPYDNLSLIASSFFYLGFGSLAIGAWLRNNEQPPYKNLAILFLISFLTSAWFYKLEPLPILSFLTSWIFMVPVVAMTAYKLWYRRPGRNDADRAAAIFCLCIIFVYLVRVISNYFILSIPLIGVEVWIITLPVIVTGIGIGLIASYMKDTQEKLASLAIRDPLTGLLNRRGFEEVSSAELALLKRKKETVAVAMIDIDHFKRVNDSYGHAAGDQALIDIVELLSDSTRDNDIVARNGGEEFIILLPEQDEESASLVCERFRSRVEASISMYNNTQFGFTISIGFVSGPACNASLNEQIEMADQALYQAKRKGRNCCVSYTEMTSIILADLHDA